MMKKVLNNLFFAHRQFLAWYLAFIVHTISHFVAFIQCLQCSVYSLSFTVACCVFSNILTAKSFIVTEICID